MSDRDDAPNETPPAGSPGPPPLPDPDQSARRSELDELTDKLMRVTADYQNYQKRMARESADARRYAVAEFAREVLTVVDDLERAMQAPGGQDPAAAPILDGVRITHEHLMALLASHGVTAIEAQGRPFDPQLHEALMQQPTDQAEPMTVLQELRKGYRMHDRTLRAARVVVAAAPQESEETA